jgi:hypothetical protein
MELANYVWTAGQPQDAVKNKKDFDVFPLFDIIIN